MDRDDRELFGQSLRRATESATGPALDAALVELGWPDALRSEPHTAIALLFDFQGRAAATSSALEMVLRDALGVESDSPVVRARTGTGIDPDGRWVTLEGVDPADAPVALRRARLALGHELVGASRQMLELARTHALERIQFGVPIASFQAVRHRLADTLVAIETADAALDTAWIDDAPHHASIAKALAGRAGRITAAHCQQVLAGIGFTLEHPFHTYLRRVLLLDEMFGSARVLTKQLGDDILASGTLPASVVL